MSPRRRFAALWPPMTAVMAPLAVAACAPNPAAPVAEPAVAAVSPVERRQPQPPAAPPPPPKPVDLSWAFTAGAESCTALATGPGGSLQIQTTAGRHVELVASFTPAARLPRSRPQAKLTFSGPAGGWTVPGAWQRGQFTSTRLLDERGVASILGLLAGGTAAINAGALLLGSVRLPPASEAGTAWVQCPKQMMTVAATR